MKKPDKIEKLIDVYVDAPPGSNPERIHILFDTRTRNIAEAYENALKISRGIPFNLNAIPVTDPLVLIISNILKIKDGNKAISVARSYYERWSYEALQSAWVLALVEDNDFINTPTPYPKEFDSPLKGMANIPEPNYDLNFPVEYRLKQLQDFLQSSDTLYQEVMSKINNAFAELVQIGEEELDEAGFQPIDVDSNRDAQDVANDDAPANKSGKRGKTAS